MTTAARRNESSASGTLLVAFELGQSRWVMGLTTSGAARPRTREIAARDTAQVLAEIERAKRYFRLPAAAPVASCYEAGRDGFWLHRWLLAQGIDNVVVDSSSIEVPRRARRAKTDQLDVDGLLRLLGRHRSGERKVWSVVRVPSVESEDARQLEREIEATKADRTRLRNRIQGLLAAQGVRLPLDRHFCAALQLARTGDGRPIPPGLCARLEREAAALATVEARLVGLAAARRTQVVPGGVCDRLQHLRGIGVNGAARLSREWFEWRQFSNGRQVGALAGLTPTPHRSGDLARERGIGKAGNRRVRSMAIELAWCWRQFQPQSALTQWYEQRFGSGPPRLRRIGIVALARKLLIALWRYTETGVVPAGAVLKGAPGR